MPDIENHLVVGNTDADLLRFYGFSSREEWENYQEPEPDDRPLCQREQMCNGCDRCQKEGK